MKNLFFFLFGLVFFTSCTKDDDNPIICSEPEPIDSLILWQVPLGADSAEYLSMHTMLIDNKILFSRRPIEVVQNETIKLVDADDGSLVWEWEEYINPNTGQRVNDYKIVGSVLVANSSQDNYGIDLLTGTTTWATFIDKGNPYISRYNDLIFHTTQNGSPWPHGDSTSILYCHADQGDWKEVLKFRNVDFEDYEISFHNPTAFENEQGDTLLVIKLEQIVIAPFDSRLDLYCYNMTQDTMVWAHRQFDPFGAASILPPLIDGDYVYYVGQRMIHCLDKLSGLTIWEWGFPNSTFGFQGSNFLIHENKFICKQDNGNLYALDKLSGTEIWSIKGVSNAGVSGAEMRVYGDRLYYGTGNLFIIDVNKGETLHKIKTPNRSPRFPHALFLHAISVDEVNKRMYTTDGYFLMCMRLPE